jgi:hypothetical protein
VPLTLGAATGHLLAGVTACIGALQVAVLDKPDPQRQQATRRLLAGLCSAVSVFIRSATGAIDALVVVLAALWGFGGGLLVARGPAAGVCPGTRGPGATNHVTAVADAFLNRAPLVALTGRGGLERMHKEWRGIGRCGWMLLLMRQAHTGQGNH